MTEPQTREWVPAPWMLRGDASAVVYRRGILAFLRYVESNVGPYDELLWLAPFRTGPGGRRHRVTRIFVSSEASARNGRANWGLPKEVAAFQVTALGANSERVLVSRAGQPIASFVWAARGTAVSFDASRVPSRVRSIVQLSDGLCLETLPSVRGQLQAAVFSELELDPELLPDARSGRWRPGFCLRDFELIFPAARIFKAPG